MRPATTAPLPRAGEFVLWAMGACPPPCRCSLSEHARTWASSCHCACCRPLCDAACRACWMRWLLCWQTAGAACGSCPPTPRSSSGSGGGPGGLQGGLRAMTVQGTRGWELWTACGEVRSKLQGVSCEGPLVGRTSALHRRHCLPSVCLPGCRWMTGWQRWSSTWTRRGLVPGGGRWHGAALAGKACFVGRPITCTTTRSCPG